MMQIVIIKIELYNKSISSLTFSNLIPSLYFQDFEGKNIKYHALIPPRNVSWQNQTVGNFNSLLQHFTIMLIKTNETMSKD